ncbi:helix-turn-helix domain-containing protein [Streptomyces sp. GS7]|uniref:helix-turn-helix domain-containing protein n=1 Tax=Streptomyces sp. GS7 TaxID=2692234 RepID=UPI00131838BE|nr:helix-turn-helix transcriptional regulator [Streptomyces sp. GS7]QHC20364.1 helix-turn-helix domain-containing protein [Streptomyces sp. GS7]
MPARKDVDGSASVPAFYGAELRWKREAAGLTLRETVEGSYFGETYLSEIEHGKRRMPVELACHVDRLLKTDGYFERRCADVRKARRAGHAEYFERILEAEKHADTIEDWAPTLIPGVLQTAPYGRALVLAEHPNATEEEVEEKVNARLARACLFESDHKTPEFWAILHESLLRQSILPPGEMAEQLDSIAALVRRRRIVVQVIPWNSGPHPLMLGPAIILTFLDAPPLVYTESSYSGATTDDPALVRRYRKAYDRLRAAAMPPEASLATIEAAAEDYRNGKQPD